MNKRTIFFTIQLVISCVAYAMQPNQHAQWIPWAHAVSSEHAISASSDDLSDIASLDATSYESDTPVPVQLGIFVEANLARHTISSSTSSDCFFGPMSHTSQELFFDQEEEHIIPRTTDKAPTKPVREPIFPPEQNKYSLQLKYGNMGMRPKLLVKKITASAQELATSPAKNNTKPLKSIGQIEGITTVQDTVKRGPAEIVPVTTRKYRSLSLPEIASIACAHSTSVFNPWQVDKKEAPALEEPMHRHRKPLEFSDSESENYENRTQEASVDSLMFAMEDIS